MQAAQIFHSASCRTILTPPFYNVLSRKSVFWVMISQSFHAIFRKLYKIHHWFFHFFIKSLNRIFIVVFEFTNFNWILAKNDKECFTTDKILTIGRLSVHSMFNFCFFCFFFLFCFTNCSKLKHTMNLLTTHYTWKKHTEHNKSTYK